MKQVSKRIVSLLLILVLVCSIVVPAEVHAAPSTTKITTTPTGYDSADDVEYKRTGKTIHNWGARGEDCIFLSTYAVQFYTGSNTYDALSDLSGSKMQNSVPSSDLYKALQTLMSSAHTFYTYYDGNKNVRDYYRYTDCVSNDTSQVAILYRGGLVTSEWNRGTIWNQEHVWPQSKLSNSKQVGDIMHLRPANPSENSSRGNTAFGSSSGYYNPGPSVRGDCARMVLYMYVRWGVTNTMWGSSGVIENQNILFQWMAEDPVDTWEMGRNDSVQSITGTRNVFVDYPELAYILFGREVPSDMTTPSGEAKEGTSTPACTHSKTETRNEKDATCTEDGYTGDTYCWECAKKVSSGTIISATGHKDNNADYSCDNCGATLNCKHSKTETRGNKAATCTEDGFTGDTCCRDCGKKLASGTKISATGHKDNNADDSCDTCGAALNCKHSKTETRGNKAATCTEDGYTGDTHCKDCGEKLASGTKISATGHKDGNADNSCDTCGAALNCKHSKTETRNKKAATCTEDGYTGDTCCKDCGEQIASGTIISATGHKDGNADNSCDTCGAALDCTHSNTQIRDASEGTCTEEGYTGDIYCTDCGEKVSSGEFIGTTTHNAHVENAKNATCTEEGYTGDVICQDCQTVILPGEVTPATGRHSYGDWMDNADGSQGRICSSCGLVETKNAQPSDTEPSDNAEKESNSTVIFIVIGSVVGAGAIAVAVVLILKKRKK